MKIAKGGIYNSNNFGGFVVLDIENANRVKVKFLDTENVTFTRSANIRKGSVKDKNRPNVFGVGFCGVGDYKVSINSKATPAYQCWHHMIQRCYDPKIKGVQPQYDDCTVCDEWHNFQNFAEWYYSNHPGDDGLHLDKDIKIKGNRQYSPDACLFVTAAENAREATAKSYKVISPSGDIIEIYNMRKFCMENNLIPGCMSRVASGKASRHKGYRSISTDGNGHPIAVCKG